MVKTMNKDAIIFACANPTPEIFPDDAKAGGAKVISTGRSDFPNQINNLSGFPYIFRGALDVYATEINEAMKIAAAEALAALAKEPVPAEVCSAYNVDSLEYGFDYRPHRCSGADGRLIGEDGCILGGIRPSLGRVSVKGITSLMTFIH